MSKKKLGMLLLVLLLLIEGIFYSTYTAENVVHNCSEHHCSICVILHDASTFMNELVGSCFLDVTFILLCVAFVGLIYTGALDMVKSTLVRLKVRLNP